MGYVIRFDVQLCRLKIGIVLKYLQKTLKMQAAMSSETLLRVYQSTKASFRRRRLSEWDKSFVTCAMA